MIEYFNYGVGVATIGIFIISYKIYRKMKIKITLIKHIVENKFEAYLVNTSGTIATVSSLKYKKLSFFSFLHKKKNLFWYFPKITTPINIGAKNPMKFPIGERTFIEKQEKFTVEIPNYDPNSNYRLYVSSDLGTHSKVFPK